MSEVDYVPVLARYDALLVRMAQRAFGTGADRRAGMLALVLQGRPVEGEHHKQPLHPQVALHRLGLQETAVRDTERRRQKQRTHFERQ